VVALKGRSGRECRAEVEHMERKKGGDLGRGTSKSRELVEKDGNIPVTAVDER